MSKTAEISLEHEIHSPTLQCSINNGNKNEISVSEYETRVLLENVNVCMYVCILKSPVVWTESITLRTDALGSFSSLWCKLDPYLFWLNLFLIL